ncbi:thermonuclease family protein [Cetobacterium sp. SF1]|uniref:thermonuclease family protein n=1 Tax=Cetobacterium sp. SF1 TaxID=3417654 RepID=UPI003CEF4249
MKKLLIIIFTLLLTTLSFALEGKVIKVADGDTITILDHHKKIRVRFYGIDAPEKHQTYGEDSWRNLNSLVYGKYVKIDVKNKDLYGRIVGLVYLDGKNINLEMVKNGDAWWYKHYAPENMEFAAAQILAKQEKKGLWKNENPEAPWEYREHQRNAKDINS